jgi:hypothetical protein
VECRGSFLEVSVELLYLYDGKLYFQEEENLGEILAKLFTKL